MKKVVILGKQSDLITSCFSGADEIRAAYSDLSDVLPDTACVLTAPGLDADTLREAVRVLSARKIPLAALTLNPSEEEQELLLDCGISNIIPLPMSAKLLQKRILLLAGSSAASGTDAGADLFSRIAQSNEERGAYTVSEDDFSNIYRFVLRLQERMDKEAKLAVFSFHTRLNTPPEPGTVEEGFRIVQRCLRRGDIACIYGKTILAILMSAGADGCKTAADRIVSTYAAHCCDSIFTLQYEIREIRN